MNEHCECEGPGFCSRHGVTKLRREYELCRGLNCSVRQLAKYWSAWEHGRMPGQSGPVDRPIDLEDPSTTKGGPGTELKKLLRDWFGIIPEPGCPCEDHAIQMDAWGAAGCRKNVNIVVGWLSEEATRRGWVLFKGAKEYGARALVNIAIKRSESPVKKNE